MSAISFQPVKWQDNHLLLLNQRELPLQVEYKCLSTVEDTWDAIRTLVVRGANAIGITAAYGLYLAIRDSSSKDRMELLRELNQAKKYLETARPTAVHMFWAMEKVVEQVTRTAGSAAELKEVVLRAAMAIQEDDILRCKSIGDYGLTALESIYQERSEKNGIPF